MSQFVSFWYGSKLGPYEHLCISSFINAGHSFILFTYDQDLNVPSGCQLRSAAEVYPKEKVFFYQETEARAPRIAAFSNMFRYRLIHETGYCWVDTDVLCLSRIIYEGPFLFARQDPEYYNGAILRFPVEHEAMRLAAEYCWERRDVCRWGDLGPRLLTRIIEEFGLEAEAIPIEKIYPIHWRQSSKLFRPEDAGWVRDQIAGAQMLHLWNETLSNNGISKVGAPPVGSFMRSAMVEAGLRHHFKSWLD